VSESMTQKRRTRKGDGFIFAINDPAVQSLYKQILDFRNDQSDGGSKFYYECYARLTLKQFEC